jgi:hypothetical protein
LVTVIDRVVSPVFQILPVVADEVNTVEPPWQKLRFPLTVGGVITVLVKVTGALKALVQFPFLALTVYVPKEVTVIDLVVSPVIQILPVAADEVNTVLPPSQKLRLPEIEGAVGAKTRRT